MKMKRLFILAAISLVCVGLLAQAASAFFYGAVFVVSGTISIQGHPAVKDQAIAAYIGEEKITETKTGDGGVFELRIPEYDPASPDIKGYHSFDDVILVKLDGKNAKPTFNPASEQLKIDLKVETTLDVKLSTWGKIKALFK